MFKPFAALALAAGIFAAPASAFTLYDAFTSFNGVQGTGGFTYGSYAATGDVFTPFTMTSGCTGFISDTICLNDGSLPAAFKTTAGAHESGTVNVPDDALILHPGNGDDAIYVEFTATVARPAYFLLADFTVQDDNPSGVDISFFYKIGGVLQFIAPIGSLDANMTDLPYFNGGPLNVGDSVGIIIDKQGVYFNDSTGVNLSLLAVPEPATWSLMIAGFGLIGTSLRRRAALAA